MKVEFLSRFHKDLDEIHSSSAKKSIAKLIGPIELVPDIRQIPNIKKLQGFKNAFRIRMGDYRLGIFYELEVIQFARIKHRKDIYKVFP